MDITFKPCFFCIKTGGLGILGGGSLTKEACREEIRKIKALTNKPFALNIMLMSPHSDDLAELAIEEDIKIIVTGAREIRQST